MSKRLSPAAIVALKDALTALYWYKNDLRSFIQAAITDRTFVASFDWTNNKRQVVSDLIDALCAQQERHLPALTRLCSEAASVTDFSHLEQLEDGRQKADRARAAVATLRRLVEPHQKAVDEQQTREERRKREAEMLKSKDAIRQGLESLKQRYMALVSATDPHGRGFDLERLMYDLFELFDLDPKASFKNLGEQVDGAFSMEGTDYLFEAKWHKEPVGIQDLDAFASKVKRKLENTLGVFLSINGFSRDGVSAHSTGRPSIFLMDGADLIPVLEERIDFVTLLLRKKRHAAQTGDIYLRAAEFLVQ